MTDPRPPLAPRLGSAPSAPAGGADDFGSDLSIGGGIFADVDICGAELELTELGEATIRSGRWSGSRWRRGLIGDTVVTESDLGNVTMRECAMQRVLFDRSRLTGLDVAGCSLRNVRITGCAVDLSNWRNAALRRVAFEGCKVSGADFATALLSEVSFVDCDLTGAEFREVIVDRVRFERCTLDGASGIASLGGAVIDPLDVVALSYQLAAALGITIATSDESE